MEKYLNLVIEYQKAKANEAVFRTTPVERTPAIIAAEAELAFRAMIGPDDDTLTRAFSQSHNALQRLSFLLESKGVIDHRELAHVWDEEPGA